MLFLVLLAVLCILLWCVQLEVVQVISTLYGCWLVGSEHLLLVLLPFRL